MFRCLTPLPGPARPLVRIPVGDDGGWLSKPDAIVVVPGVGSAPPSFLAALANDERYMAVVSLKAIDRLLPGMLRHLIATPGRWILILSAGSYYVQFLAYENGALLAEAVSNAYLPEPLRLTDADNARLIDLGWAPPKLGRRSNWQHVEAPDNPDTNAVSRLAVATLQDVYRVGYDEFVTVKMFASSQRG